LATFNSHQIASSKDPNIVNIPTPAPTIVGQSTPELGSVGGTGVPVGPGVPLQTQFVLAVQDGFLQKPL